MDFLHTYHDRFLEYLEAKRFSKEPTNLYEPVNYILSLGGKRIRPLLLMMAADIVGNKSEEALDAAMAVEVFHNFTLLHDDIMDEAPLRRGMPTVHKKYDTNTAILSGDVMMVYASQYISSYEPLLSYELHKIFNKMAIEVCEGQQMDMDFEIRSDVTISDYFDMIKYKTSVLIGAALQMGALIGGLDAQSANHLYHFGVNVGIAFQLQDDVLDTFGSGKVGKQAGGDIIQNKKTYLYLKALELTGNQERDELKSLYSQKPTDSILKVARVREIFEGVHVLAHVEEVKSAYKDLATSHLEAVSMTEVQKAQFRQFRDFLLERSW